MLSQNPQFMQILIESLPQFVWTCTPEGSCDFINHRWVEYTGIPEEEQLGYGWLNQIHPEDQQDLKLAWEQTIATGSDFHFEFRIRRHDGVYRWFDTRAVPFRDQSGQILKWLGSNTDIQEQREMREALRESVGRSRISIEAAQMGTWDRDLKSNKLFWSEVQEKQMGFEPGTFPGTYEAFYALVHPDDRAVMAEAQKVALSNGGNYRAELRFILPDGRERWGLVRGQIFFDQLGQPERIVGVDLDITERKKAEEERQKTERRFRALIEHSADSIAVIDADNNILYLSPSVEAVEGYKPEELIGRNGKDHTHPDDLPYLQEIVQQLLDNPGKPIPVLWRRSHKKGYWIWLEGVATNLLHDPAVKGIVTNYRDVTERKRTEELNFRSQKLEALGTLAGGIAHDFNNILQAIGGNAALAVTDLPPDHKAQESLNEIIKAAARASEMVRRILAFTNPHDRQQEVIQIQPVIEEALKLLRATIPGKIEIRTDFASNLMPIKADSTLIHQIVINLATNAAHAIGNSEGLIEFQLEAIVVSQEFAALSPGLSEGRYIRLKVSDNGCGMDRAVMNRIFDPYFTTKSAGQGTGLGLSVVHGLVKSLGGIINVYSQPNKGTSFHLYFPAMTEANNITNSKVEPNKKISSVRNERVLYVDDEESLVILTTRMLNRLGYQITGYSNPFEALEAFRLHPEEFDVVITDLSMPGMSGFELARELMAVRPEIPIIMTSGYVRSEDQEAASQIGIRELILKPDTVDELGRALDRLFQATNVSD